MKVRDVVLVNAKTESDSGSDTWQLPKPAKILSLRIIEKATNGATSNTVGKLKHWLSKIQVVDGSFAIASLSGREAYASYCFCNGVGSFQDLSGGAGVVITDEVPIMFGRFMNDREYYLDTSQLVNPQLSLTWANTVSATAGIATGTTSFSVIARVIEDGAVPYKGYLMRKEVLSWTTAASGDQHCTLPLDFPYMGIYVAALKTTISPDTIITNFKLSRNTDQFIDFNISGTQAYSKNVQDYGYFLQKFRPLVDTAATWLGDLYYQTGAYFSRPGATAKSITTAVAAESVTTVATTGGTADLTELTLAGQAPGAAVYLPFHAGDPYNPPQPDDFLNPAGLGILDLIMTQGVVSGAGTVVVEQVHP